MLFSATRLAPSATGALHLGHARTFLTTWWMARRCGAKIYMRMEDLDAGRAKPESVLQAYDDLRWLGMNWDAFAPGGDVSPAEVENGVVVQSRRMERYAAALGELMDRECIYPCTCTRADIAAAVERAGNAPHEGEADVRYPGTCREKLEIRNPKLETDPWTWGRKVIAAAGKPVCFRLRVPEGSVAFTDFFAGPQALDVAKTAGDFPLTRFWNGTGPIPPAYQLACVVDDHAMEIDSVIRGDDLLPQHAAPASALSSAPWNPPAFAHVPLVVGTDGKRLAKRHGESRIAQFRIAGVSPERIIGWAAWRSGQLDKPAEISAAEMIARFDPARLPPERVVLGEADLAWLR